VSCQESSLVVGVAPAPALKAAAAELFELFKVPWAFADNNSTSPFAAAIVSSSSSAIPNTNLLVCVGPAESPIDRQLNLVRSPRGGGLAVRYGDESYPLFTSVAVFEGAPNPIGLQTEDGCEVAAVVDLPNRRIIRLGYDLFAEVEHLLSTGQSREQALAPTLELHIHLLRTMLVAQGVLVAEIAATPYGHPFVACLTHDIDFIGIRHHVFDRTLAGFVLRALRSLVAPGGRGWAVAKKNLAALLSLPGVLFRLIPDFWYPIDRYAAAEEGLPSTYFFIPFRGRPGRSPETKSPTRTRAVSYDVTKYATDLKSLEHTSHEVGVHGIDAWCDAASGAAERRVINGITDRDTLGVRMHWLYYAKQSPQLLEEAGYAYDATLGFNDAVGFRNGTTQVFRPLGADTLLELPLNIQDTALLFPTRMGLSEAQALVLCDRLIALVARFGGVLTVNWHDRSLAPERNWNGLYAALLTRLRRTGACFSTAGRAVEWFRRRRAARFVSAVRTGRQVRLTIDNVTPALPALQIRLHQPGGSVSTIPLDARGEYVFDLC
jgi:hypothetical protein